MHAQKPQNINDQISTLEIHLGELHAKLPRSSQDSVPCHDQAQLVWRAPEGLEGLAAVPVGGGGAWWCFEPTHKRTSATRPNWCGGRRRVWRAWLRCPWAVAGPGRASSRRAERSSLRGRLAGGPPPTGTPSSPAQRAARPSGQPGPAGSPAPHARGWSAVRKLNGAAGRASS